MSQKPKTARVYPRSPSTMDNVNNARARRALREKLDDLLRQVLVSNGPIRHAQVGIVAVVEGGEITGYSVTDIRTEDVSALL